MSITSPYDLQTKYWYALALFHSGDKRGARVQLQETLGIRGDYSQAAMLLAEVEASLGNQREARKLLDEAVRTCE